MTEIKSLPSAGANFSAKFGLGSFQNKLHVGMSSAGQLSTLKQHPNAVKALVDEVAKRQQYIRAGGLTQAQITAIKSNVMKADPSMTSVSKELLHKTLTHLSKENAAATNTPPPAAPKKIIIRRDLGQPESTHHASISGLNRQGAKGSASTVATGAQTAPGRGGVVRSQSFGGIAAAMKAKQSSQTKGSALEDPTSKKAIVDAVKLVE